MADERSKQEKLAFAEKEIKEFLTNRKAMLHKISESLSNAFEALSIIYFSSAYEEILGYKKAIPMNLEKGDRYRFMCSTNGNPSNFSYILLEKDGQRFEIRHNLKVGGALDSDLIYTADIAVVKEGSVKEKIPQRKKRKEYWVANDDLITFAECKNLAAYSMLIAQFLGIVMELMPNHIVKSKNRDLRRKFAGNHIFPSLLIANHTWPGAKKVKESIDRRLYSVIIADKIFSSPDELYKEIKSKIKYRERG